MVSRWMWVESMSVASGCGCKEVYKFPHITYLYFSCIYLFVFAAASHVHFLKCFSFLFQYFFVIKFYELKKNFRALYTHTGFLRQPYEGLHMFYTRRSTHKQPLHILRWTSAVCLQGAGCRSRSNGRALYRDAL